MGVWIETRTYRSTECGAPVTPCMGVWIETTLKTILCRRLEVTPCMGVWIETPHIRRSQNIMESHPVWVCGLKHKPKNLKGLSL